MDAMMIQSSTTPVSSPRFIGFDDLPLATTAAGTIETPSTTTSSSSLSTPIHQSPFSTQFHHHNSGGSTRFAASSPPKSSPLVYSIPTITFQPSSSSSSYSFNTSTNNNNNSVFPASPLSSSSASFSSSPPSAASMLHNPAISMPNSLVCRPQKRINFKLIQVDPSKETKRLKLPKSAIKVLSQWFAQHQDNPYPDDNDKTELAAQTNLTRTQINNWFSYARRRASKNKPPV